jgi:hypothetical protein
MAWPCSMCPGRVRGCDTESALPITLTSRTGKTPSSRRAGPDSANVMCHISAGGPLVTIVPVPGPARRHPRQRRDRNGRRRPLPRLDQDQDHPLQLRRHSRPARARVRFASRSPLNEPPNHSDDEARGQAALGHDDSSLAPGHMPNVRALRTLAGRCRAAGTATPSASPRRRSRPGS